LPAAHAMQSILFSNLSFSNLNAVGLFSTEHAKEAKLSEGC